VDILSISSTVEFHVSTQLL